MAKRDKKGIGVPIGTKGKATGIKGMPGIIHRPEDYVPAKNPDGGIFDQPRMIHKSKLDSYESYTENGKTKYRHKDSPAQKRRSDGSMAKLKGQSFMKRMKMMNQASPTRLVQGEHDSVNDFLKPGYKKTKNKIKDITKTIYDKITKVTTNSKFPNPGTMHSTQPYAPKGGGLNTINKIKDLFGK